MRELHETDLYTELPFLEPTHTSAEQGHSGGRKMKKTMMVMMSLQTARKQRGLAKSKAKAKAKGKALGERKRGVEDDEEECGGDEEDRQAKELKKHDKEGMEDKYQDVQEDKEIKDQGGKKNWRTKTRKARQRGPLTKKARKQRRTKTRKARRQRRTENRRARKTQRAKIWKARKAQRAKSTKARMVNMAAKGQKKTEIATLMRRMMRIRPSSTTDKLQKV